MSDQADGISYALSGSGTREEPPQQLPSESISALTGVEEPHASLENLWDGTWECAYCHLVNTWDRINGIPCLYTYPPCRHCGLTPICANDCCGIIDLLIRPDIYLAGLQNEAAS